MISEKYLTLTTNSLVRFVLVGVVNTCIGLAVMFVLLNAAGLSYWLSTFTGNAVGAFVSFTLNRAFTFKSTVSYQKGLPAFLVIILLCYFISYFLSEKLGMWLSHSGIISPVMEENTSVLIGSVLYTISNYLGQKYVVFKQ